MKRTCFVCRRRPATVRVIFKDKTIFGWMCKADAEVFRAVSVAVTGKPANYEPLPVRGLPSRKP